MQAFFVSSDSIIAKRGDCGELIPDDAARPAAISPARAAREI